MSWSIISSGHYSEKSLRVRLKIQEVDWEDSSNTHSEMSEILTNTASASIQWRFYLGKVPPRKNVWQLTQDIGLLQKGSKRVDTDQNPIVFCWSAGVLQLIRGWDTLTSTDVYCVMASKLPGGLTKRWNRKVWNIRRHHRREPDLEDFIMYIEKRLCWWVIHCFLGKHFENSTQWKKGQPEGCYGCYEKIPQLHTARNSPTRRTCKICAGKHPTGLYCFKLKREEIIHLAVMIKHQR